MLLMHCLCISRFSGGASEPQQREQNAKKYVLKTDPVPVSNAGEGGEEQKSFANNTKQYEI